MKIQNRIATGLAVATLASLLAVPSVASASPRFEINFYPDMQMTTYPETVAIGAPYRVGGELWDDASGMPPDEFTQGAQEAFFLAGFYPLTNGQTCTASPILANARNILAGFPAKPLTPAKNLAVAQAIRQGEGTQIPFAGQSAFMEAPSQQPGIFEAQLTAPSQPTTLHLCEIGAEWQVFLWKGKGIGVPTLDTLAQVLTVNVVKPTTPPPTTGNPTTGGTSPNASGSPYITILPPYPGTASENAYNEAMLSMPLLPTTGHETTSTSPDKKSSVITFATQTWTSAVLVKWAFSTPFPDIYGQASGEHAWGFSTPSYNPTLTITVPPNGVGIQFKYPVVATITFTVEQQQTTTTTTNAGEWVKNAQGVYVWTGHPNTSTSTGATTTQTYSKSYRVSSLGSVLN